MHYLHFQELVQYVNALCVHILRVQVFHVTGIDLSDPMTFHDQNGGWTYVSVSIYNHDLSLRVLNGPFFCCT